MAKSTSGNKKIHFTDKYSEACVDCALKAGGRWPEGHVATVHRGDCSVCKKEATTLIPTRDFVWKGKTFIWD